MSPSTASKLVVLNDEFRREGPRLDSRNMWVFTHGVDAKGMAFVAQAISLVRKFETFTENNDPYGQHDFGAF